MRAARSRPLRMSSKGSPTRFRPSVGAWMVGRMLRISVWAYVRISACAAPGARECRSYRRPGQLALIGDNCRGCLAHPLPLTEVISDPHRLLLHALLGSTPTASHRFAARWPRPRKAPARYALRIGSGKERGDEAAITGGEDDCTVGSNRVQDHREVIHEGLDRRRLGWHEPLRAPQAPTVGDDQPTQPGQLAKKAGQRAVLPIEIDVGKKTLQIDEVDGPSPNT